MPYKNYLLKIQFALNKGLEKDLFKNFQNPKPALWAELGFLLTPPFKTTRQKILSACVDYFYKVHRREIEENLKKIESNWGKIEKYFYNQVNKIFKNYPWPQGDYRAYASIWNMFPRFVDKKIFTVPAFPEWHGGENFALIVIAHEMLHFITYDYLINKYHLKPSESEDKNNTFWQFTENLNVLIENGKGWRRFTGGFKSRPYKDCEKFYIKMKRVWDKNKDIDNLTQKVLVK